MNNRNIIQIVSGVTLSGLLIGVLPVSLWYFTEFDEWLINLFGKSPEYSRLHLVMARKALIAVMIAVSFLICYKLRNIKRYLAISLLASIIPGTILIHKFCIHPLTISGRLRVPSDYVPENIDNFYTPVESLDLSGGGSK